MRFVRRQTRSNHLVRYAPSGIITGCVALCLTAPALGAGGLSVKSQSWEIGINDGPNHKVGAGGTYKYCASKTIGVLTPEISLSAVPVGEDYSFAIAGPSAAGASLQTEAGSFTGQGTMIDPAFIPLAFPKLKAKDASSFPPGSYRFTLTVSGAPALSESVKLIRRSGC